MSDIYLKHPGNESSDDDEGTEEQNDNDEEMKNVDLQSYLDTRRMKEKDKGSKMNE